MIRFRRRADLQLRYASSQIRAIFPTPRKGERTHGHHESVTLVSRRFSYLSPRPVRTRHAYLVWSESPSRY
jgi:hypothetical protein